MSIHGTATDRPALDLPLPAAIEAATLGPRGFSALTARHGLPAGVARVVALACQGLECKEIAAALGLSESTIKKKLRLAARRLDARGRGHLCALSAMLATGLKLEEARALLGGHPDSPEGRSSAIPSRR